MARVRHGGHRGLSGGKKCTMTIRDWKTVHNHFIIEVGNRVGDQVYV